MFLVNPTFENTNGNFYVENVEIYISKLAPVSGKSWNMFHLQVLGLFGEYVHVVVFKKS